MSAIVSPCGLYRYRLERTVGMAGPVYAFFGINPSTPQGWKQIGWTCGDGDCGRIHEAPGADGAYAVPVYVQAPPEQGGKG